MSNNTPIANPIDNTDIELNRNNRTAKWILFFFLIIVYSVIYFFVMSLDRFPEMKELQLWIKILVYFFVMIIFFGPFIPVKKRGKKRVSIVNSLIRMIEGPKKRKYKKKPQSSLNVTYKPPLISKCRCGFLLTRQMAKCPNCQRTNQYYIPKD